MQIRIAKASEQRLHKSFSLGLILIKIALDINSVRRVDRARSSWVLLLLTALGAELFALSAVDVQQDLGENDGQDVHTRKADKEPVVTGCLVMLVAVQESADAVVDPGEAGVLNGGHHTIRRSDI